MADGGGGRGSVDCRPMPGKGAKPDTPRAPGWYPDPWSAAQFNVRDYGDGDRRGLALLGTQACYPEL